MQGKIERAAAAATAKQQRSPEAKEEEEWRYIYCEVPRGCVHLALFWMCQNSSGDGAKKRMI